MLRFCEWINRVFLLIRGIKWINRGIKRYNRGINRINFCPIREFWWCDPLL
ncbi:hypothetical protein THIOM_000957 [Candidatus Thiomargarita nelsonii]|uniref:Uncharacterized protein n=1 Tax=Candidatus Thiomargarita nelsonii TaxID=1003181 RepID=A0A176S5I4_9GAMM|nr:hypothetical protein THIOM_000957 [Candidatus Thiomargarita nelsonii]